MCERPQGRGYSRLKATDDHPWLVDKTTNDVASVPAHEFHFARIKNLPVATRFAYQILRGQGIDGNFDGIIQGNLLAGFCHMRNSATNKWADEFVEFVRRVKMPTL